jgi:RimJ/RimL family protein N-acetyltransferase
MTSPQAGQRTPRIPAGRAAAQPTTPLARTAGQQAGPQPELTDGTVRLRAFSEADIGRAIEACRDPETQRWTTVPSPYNREHAEFFVLQHAPAQWRTGSGVVWVTCGPDGLYAGSMDLRLNPIDPGVGNVGFLCAPWARGRGLTTAALRLACRWGFEALGLARIEWRAYVGNDASRRVAEKVGFVMEGTARRALVQRDQRRDAWMGSVLPADLR